LNLLIEEGCDLKKTHNYNMTVVDEIIRSDNRDLLNCIYKLV